MDRNAIVSTVSALCLSLVMTAPTLAGDGVDLVKHMGTMQYMAHKAGLSIDARNQPLADFYVHEIEEIIEELETVQSFDGHPIGELVESMLLPGFENLEGAVKSGDWEAATQRFDDMLSACNSCHETTAHAYVRIQRSRSNPFMQSFAAE